VSRLPVADDFEALAAATVLERGPVPIKASKGRTRTLRTEEGAPVTHGQVLEGAAAKAGVSLEVQWGRPSHILCACKSLVKVGQRGAIPTMCKACRAAASKTALQAQNRASQKKWREANRDLKRKRDREAYHRKTAAAVPDDGLALPTFDTGGL
jgi:hypothetical protein